MQQLLHQADIIPVTSKQDFFGISTVEAIYCNCSPHFTTAAWHFQNIFPKSKQADHFYESQPELIAKMKTCCEKFEQLRQAPSLQNFVTQYDWSILAAEYDRQFDALIKK